MLSGYTCASTIHLQVWDLAEGRVLRELRGHTDTITNLAWGSDSRQILCLDPWLNNNLLHRLLVSGGREGAVRVWDAAGAEGADVLAALGAGAGAQVSLFWFQ